jgi:hypothetical protein
MGGEGKKTALCSAKGWSGGQRYRQERDVRRSLTSTFIVHITSYGRGDGLDINATLHFKEPRMRQKGHCFACNYGIGVVGWSGGQAYITP